MKRRSIPSSEIAGKRAPSGLLVPSPSNRYSCDGQLTTPQPFDIVSKRLEEYRFRALKTATTARGRRERQEFSRPFFGFAASAGRRASASASPASWLGMDELFRPPRATG